MKSRRRKLMLDAHWSIAPSFVAKFFFLVLANFRPIQSIERVAKPRVVFLFCCLSFGSANRESKKRNIYKE